MDEEIERTSTARRDHYHGSGAYVLNSTLMGRDNRADSVHE